MKPALFVTALSGLFILGCSDKKFEPHDSVKWHVDNQLPYELEVIADHDTKRITLADTSVAANSREHIFAAFEGDGGYVQPSYYMTSFQVYARTPGGDSLVYYGVNNNDWIMEGDGNDGVTDYVLTIN